MATVSLKSSAAHIFEKFAQANWTATNRKGGSGLGSNISRAIIQHHGGVLAFDTELGVGLDVLLRAARPLTDQIESDHPPRHRDTEPGGERDADAGASKRRRSVPV